MEIRRLESCEKETAMDLAWRVFQKFEASEYAPEGVQTFHAYITDPAAVAGLTVYGAIAEKTIIGVLALRPGGTHISLFFVDPAWHRQGVGKALFRRFLADSSAEKVTVHSSPYAVEIYRRLGFYPTASEQVADGIRYTPMVYAGAPQAEADISR